MIGGTHGPVWVEVGEGCEVADGDQMSVYLVADFSGEG